MESQPELPWQRLATFVRQHTHDVRNHLNGLDLEAALLVELVDNREAKESINRMRQQIRNIAADLRGLSAKFVDPRAMRTEVAGSDLVLIWKDQVNAVSPAPQVDWHDDVGSARLNVDVEAVARAFRELLTNAVAFGTGEPLRAEAEAGEGRAKFRLIEPKAEALDPAPWGRMPFISTRRGGYGLGLWEMERHIQASGGEVERHYDPAANALTTTLTFAAV